MAATAKAHGMVFVDHNVEEVARTGALLLAPWRRQGSEPSTDRVQSSLLVNPSAPMGARLTAVAGGAATSQRGWN